MRTGPILRHSQGANTENSQDKKTPKCFNTAVICCRVFVSASMNNGLYSQPVQPQEVSTLVSENVQKGHRKQIETFLLNLHFNFQE